MIGKIKQRIFIGDENVLNFILGGGYIVICNCLKIIEENILEVCMLFYVNYVLIF